VKAFLVSESVSLGSDLILFLETKKSDRFAEGSYLKGVKNSLGIIGDVLMIKSVRYVNEIESDAIANIEVCIQ
jgi:hypothetical protein